MHYKYPTKDGFHSIDADKERKIFPVAEASKIYVNNSKGTDVAWKAIRKQQKTKSCLFKLCLTIAVIFFGHTGVSSVNWNSWSGFQIT